MTALWRRIQRTQAETSDFEVRSISRTHVGRVRAINEDRLLDLSGLGLWAVADGMGGQARGDVAAETVISHLASLAAPLGPEQLNAALERANREVYAMARGDSGTTLVLLHIDRGIATLHWAGDSRAYLIRRERLTLLTRDHSLVQELVDAGLLEPDRAALHPQANVITRALGIAPQPNLESLSIALQRNDRFLLCSDGLSRTLEERDVEGRASISEQADRLLLNALRRDGSDNLSLVIIELV